MQGALGLGRLYQGSVQGLQPARHGVRRPLPDLLAGLVGQPLPQGGVAEQRYHLGREVVMTVDNSNGKQAGLSSLIVNDTEKAFKVLREQNFTVSKTEVIGVEVPDSPGGLSSILKVLDQNNVNVEYMYAFVERSGDNAVIIFRFDDVDEAIKVLSDNGIRVIEGSKITSI